jgi:hypothetical protein
VAELQAELELELHSRTGMTPSRRLFAAGAAGDIVSVPLGRRGFADPSGALVVWRPRG